MFGKVFIFLVEVAINGFLAIFIAAVFYIILAFVFLFAMIPVSVIVGKEGAREIIDFTGNGLGYKVVYVIVFISMMMDDLGIPNLKTIFKRWGQNINTIFTHRRQKKDG